MKTRNLRYWILTADWLWGLGALGLTIALHYGLTRNVTSFTNRFQDHSLIVLVVLAAWTLLYFEMGLDGFKGGWHFPAVFSKVVVAVSVAMVVVLAFAYLTKHYYSRLVLVYFALLFALGLVGLRCLVRLWVASKLRKAANHRCVILGNGRLARELADKIASHPELPFRVVGFLFPGEPETPKGFAGSFETPITPIKTLQVLDLLAQQNVRKLIIAMREPHGTEIQKLLGACRKASMEIYLVPDFYDLYVSRAELAEIDGLPLLSLRERAPSGANLALKRATDLILSAVTLSLISPVLWFAALVVYCKKGRAFRSELRCGKDGMLFPMYRLNVDRHAPNPERCERFLLRWSLTELPQLWNVLRGDMSLVGPRPESAERLKYYSDWHRQRLKVRGGVTGLAQVHGLREQHSSEDKARFDLQYILNWSPFLDLSLVLQTVWELLTRGLRPEAAPTETTSFRASTGGYLGREVTDVNRS
ncbi:MAG TPA: sugar transferase [Candidatus Angelobacter sp.]|nr:sugar transferase [Candidatus Angelobacter sp.]